MSFSSKLGTKETIMAQEIDTCISAPYEIYKPKGLWARATDWPGVRGWRIGRAAARAVGTLYAWRERARQRRCLMTLGPRELRDIGISRADAEMEARKPFWRA